jgi:hypothetical protein
MAEALTQWQRDMASKVAAAHPLTHAAPIRATGNHLAAQNDEPEGARRAYGCRCHLCGRPRANLRSTWCTWCHGSAA